MTIDTEAYRIQPGTTVDLSEYDTRDTQGFDDKDEAKEALRANLNRIAELQERLYAEDRQSLLLVLQAMDTAGKDSTIEAVTEGLNPQGVRVASFKKPTELELSHDFLWRVHAKAPERGHIHIFNRSHYGDVLVVRVRELAPLDLVERRYDHINHFERLLYDEGTRIVKVMLHVSKDYQLKRLRRRLRRPDKHWKFNPADLEERKRWGTYMEAYEIALSRCSTDYAPWYVVPAERRWFRNVLVTQLLLDTLEAMNPQFPEPSFDPADYPPGSLA